MPPSFDKLNAKQAAVLMTIVYLLLLGACNTGENHNEKKAFSFNSSHQDVSEQLQQMLKPVDTTNGKKQIRTIADNVRYTYELNGYQPIWLSSSGRPAEAAKTLLSDLSDLYWDGLDTMRYHISAISKLMGSINGKTDAATLATFDTSLTSAYLAAARDLLFGAIAPKKVDSLWFHKNDTVWNVPEVLAKGKYEPLADFRSKMPEYGMLREEMKRYSGMQSDSALMAAINAIGKTDPSMKPDSATVAIANAIIDKEIPWLQGALNDSVPKEKQLISGYQYYTSVKPTGKLDSATLARLSMKPADIMKLLAANMERMRWMQQQTGDQYIVVDVPMMELFFKNDGHDAMHMRVVVGRPSRQTPSLDANMANVVINPPWGVPPTILKKDVLPGITKSGSKYLAKKGLKAYDHQGKVINASKINASNYKRYTYKQSPGDDNSLGYVKFNLPNPWDIYLHDTPHRGDFGKSYRALSSGCIRLQRPQEMAIYILSDLEKKRYDQDRLDSIISTHKTRWEILKSKIPVHIVYLTAFQDSTGSHVRFAHDIYGRDEKLISALK